MLGKVSLFRASALYAGVALLVGCGGRGDLGLDVIPPPSDDGKHGAAGSPTGGSADAGSRGPSTDPNACAAAGRYIEPPAFPTDGSGFRLGDPQNFPSDPPGFYFLGVGDLSADGRPDLLATGPDANTSWFMQSDSGALGQGRSLANSRAQAFVMIDVDDDSRLDAVLSVAGTDGIEVLRSLGGGQFAEPIPIAGAHSFALRAADVDGDGRLDVVGLSRDMRHPVIIYRGNGQSFDEPITWSTSDTTPLGLLAIGDVTGDGRPDIIVTNLRSEVVVYPRQADGSYPADGAHYPLTQGNGELGLDVGDVDGDGRADVVVSEGGSGVPVHLSMLAQNGSGQLTSPAMIYQYPTVQNLSVGGSVRIADVNLDGHADIVNVSADSLRIFLGSAAGFLPPLTYMLSASAGVYQAALAVGDLDCNGCPDVAVADNGAFHVYSGQGCASQ